MQFQPWDDPSIIGLDEMNSRERDKAFAKSTFRQYWIINKKEKDDFNEWNFMRPVPSNSHGPFTKEEFLIKRKELGVPDSLKIRE